MARSGRARYNQFMRGYAREHGLTLDQARRDPRARAWYAMSHDAPRGMIARAWEEAGYLEYDDDTGEWRYLGETA